MTKSSLGCSSSYFWVSVQAEENVQWSLLLSFGEEQPWASLVDTCSTSISAEGSGNALVKCYYKANTSEVSRSMTINLTSAGGKTTSYSIAQRGNLPPGSMPGWMELPEPRTEYEFAAHYFKYGFYTYRNFSVGFSAENHLSVWVAYPLNKFYTNGSTVRTDTWAYDPDIATSSQPCLFHGYRSNTERIDRGHQLPSADRLCCEAANNQTFYFTNITPQRNSFNTSVWVTLEGRVRAFSAKCDTLYVVTGAIVGSSPSYAHDNNGIPCPIPSYYYKALLAYKNKSTFGHSCYQAAGYWLDHSTGSQTRMSIRALESKVGFDLFPNLKAEVGETTYDTIEKEDPSQSSFWN